MRREWPLIVRCTEPGCSEVARYKYDTLKDLQSSFERKHSATYKCVLHSNPERVLSMAKLRTEWVSPPSRQESYGRFWGSRGILIDTAYFATADDFPAGTRVRITCEVLLPDTSTPGHP